MTTEPEAAPADRTARRKARTRGALVAAAQQLLAEGRSNVSIQEITETADVGFGSFYNHFSSKEELFAEAVSATLAAYVALLEQARTGIEDPAELFAASFRLTGRLNRRMPEHVRILLNTGIGELFREQGVGLVAMARHDLAGGIASGRFDVDDPEVALMLVAGGLLGLLQLVASRPDLDEAEVSDRFAERLLRALGLSAKDARTVCHRPLPELSASL